MSAAQKRKTRKHPVALPKEEKDVFDVLYACQGNMTEAAERMNVTRDTLHKYLKKSDKRWTRYQDIGRRKSQKILDLAETALERNLKSKDGKVSNRASSIALQFMGKRRGYVPASHVEQDTKEDVVIRVVREGDK